MTQRAAQPLAAFMGSDQACDEVAQTLDDGDVARAVAAARVETIEVYVKGGRTAPPS